VAEQYYVLTEEAIEALSAFMEEQRGRRPNTVQRPRVQPDAGYPAPDVYVAQTPAGGIPALANATGTGEIDDPGFADCQIFRIITVPQSGTGTNPSAIYELSQVGTFTQRVFNVSTTAVPGGIYMPIFRDKFGSWLTDLSGEASGSCSGSGCCVDEIGGIPLQDLPGYIPGEEMVLGISATTPPCLILIPIAQCASGSGM
jgi:hypothetical protein